MMRIIIIRTNEEAQMMASSHIAVAARRTLSRPLAGTALYRWAVFGVLAAAQIIVIFHRSSIAVMAPDLVETFGISASALGLLGSMYFYPYALMQLPAGILADVVGPRKLAASFFTLAGAGALLFSFAPGFPVLILARLLTGLDLSCIYVPALKVISTWFRKDEFGTLAGLLVSLGNIGGVIAAAPLAVLISQYGWRYTVRRIGLLTLLMAALIYLIVRNAPAQDSSATAITTEKNAPGVSRLSRNDIHSAIQGLITITANRNFRLLALRAFVFYGSIMSFTGLWGGPYLIQAAGMIQLQAGNLLLLFAAGSIIAAPIGGYLSDRICKSRRGPTLAATVLCAACWIPLAYAPDRLNSAFLAFLLFTLGMASGLGAAGFAQVKELYPDNLAGTASGVYNFFVMAGGAVFQVVFGLIIKSSAPLPGGAHPPAAFGAGFRFLFISLVIGTLAVLLSREETTKQMERL
jgi:sugar phosphate permease